MEFMGSYNQQQQQQQQNQYPNRYPNQGFNRDYRQNGQNGQNENRPFYKKSQYQNNQGNQNGQNYQKGFFKGNRSGYKGNFNGKNNNFGSNQGNQGGFKPRNQEAPVKLDQRQIQQLEEMLKSIKHQQYTGHVNGQSTGLGNDGHQPLNSSVVLDIMEVSNQ